MAAMLSIVHSALSVSDLDRSISFYRDVLGLTLELGPTEITEGRELADGVGVPNARLRQAILAAEQGKVELIEYVHPPRPSDKPPPQNVLGAIHIAFKVNNAEAKMEELKAKGVEFHTPLNIIEDGPLKGWKWVYFKDPDGITLELVEAGPAD